MNPKITIAIPTHNSEKTIKESIESALSQQYPHKEILIIDDHSSDGTAVLIRTLYPKVRLIVNDKNIGIGKNLQKLMKEAKGKYIVYLCGDDIFTGPKVVDDIVRQFDMGDQGVGILGRYFYFFMNGISGAIGVCRDKNILTQSCCPSGMAFRVDKDVEVSNDIFVEMPSLVAYYLNKWKWSMFEYDTVAARFHPGGNTGTKKEYYTQSPTQNWINLVGKDFKNYEIFVMLKNRAPKMLLSEIKIVYKNNKKCLKDKSFWVYALIAILTPGFILRPMTNIYRNKITRRKSKIIERPR